MVTRSGSNTWHGGLFEQHRNQSLNANSYFNNLNGTAPRDHLVFNQFGGLVGGPIKHNKLFFFTHVEVFQLPQTYTEPTGTVLTPEAINGIFRYRDTAGAVRSRQPLPTRRRRRLPLHARPAHLAESLSRLQHLTDGAAGSEEPHRHQCRLQPQQPGFPEQGRQLPALPHHAHGLQRHREASPRVRLELSDQHPPAGWRERRHRQPDLSRHRQRAQRHRVRQPGRHRVLRRRGAALHAHHAAGQRDPLRPGRRHRGLQQRHQPRRFRPVARLCSHLRHHARPITSPIPYRTTGQTRRNTPLKQGNVNLTYSMSAHLLNFGGSFTQLNTWTTSVNGTQIIPTIAFGAATGDPIITGATNMFTAANFPGANATDMQTNAPALYSLLTGRVSSINRSVVSDEKSKQYGAFQPIVRNHQREVRPLLPGFLEIAPAPDLQLRRALGPPESARQPERRLHPSRLCRRVGRLRRRQSLQAGHAHRPGSGLQCHHCGRSRLCDPRNKQFSPSVGLAWQVPKRNGPAGLDSRQGHSVIRAGYAINTIREDGSTLCHLGQQPGPHPHPECGPDQFPGQFRRSRIACSSAIPCCRSRPAPTTPSFPLAVAAGNSVTDFDPNLKTGYVQSWDIGIQRELTRDTVLEVRYVGNHGTRSLAPGQYQRDQYL